MKKITTDTVLGMGRDFIEGCSTGLQRLFFMLMFALLGACGGGGDDTASNDPAPTNTSTTTTTSSGNPTIQVSGLAVDGPVSNATVTVFDADGSQIGQGTTDSAGRFTVTIPANSLYPLTVRVTGGIDIITNVAPSIDLVSVLPSGQTVLLTPFSTLAVKNAECIATNAGGSARVIREARNALTNGSVDTLLGSLVGFGLNSGVRSQLLTSIPSGSTQSSSLLLSSEQLAEVLRRASRFLSGSTPNQVLNLIACDISNGTLDGTETGSSNLVATLFQLAAAEVLLEAASGQLKVDGAVVNSRLETAASRTFNTTAVSSMTIDAGLLELLLKIVNAANIAQPSVGLTQLFNVLNGLTAPVSASTLATALGSLTSPSPLRAVIETPSVPTTVFLASVQTLASTANITFNPTTANLGQSVQVVLTSTNTTGCNASLTRTSGTVSVSSGDTFNADVGDSVTLTCNRTSGGTIVASKSLPVRAARLAWDKPLLNEDNSAASGLTGYKIYHGTTSGSRTSVINIADPNQLSTTISLPSGTRFFQVTAISGIFESRYSSEVSKVIP